MNSPTDWKTNFTDFLRGRGKIQQLAELTAVQHMQAMSEDTKRNIQAESAHVRKTAWGDAGTQSTNTAEEDTTMGNTILGDINQPPAVVITQPAPAQSNLSTALALALAGLVPVGVGAAGAGAAAAYLLSKPNEQVVAPEYEDTSVSIGLGRLEDFESK